MKSSEKVSGSELRQFISSIHGCYQVVGETAEILKNLIPAFRGKTGLEKIMEAFQIIHQLQTSSDIIRLNRLASIRDYSETEGKRMDDVMQFLLAESHRPMGLMEISEKANMSKEAFCRFFRERTGKTCTAFVNELRISKACHILRETDFSIAQAAYQSGFQNLSYFNRAFKKITHQTPKSFRKQIPVLKHQNS